MMHSTIYAVQNLAPTAKSTRLNSPRPLAALRAFTLLETMIAISLLGLIVSGSFALLVGSYATMRRTEESLYVTRLLESAVEMTRNLSFTDIAGDPDTGITGYASSSPIKFKTDSTILRGKNNNILFNKGVPDASDPAATMPLADGSGTIALQKINDDLYRVTATVTWTPFKLGTHSQSVTTYVAKGGIDKR